MSIVRFENVCLAYGLRPLLDEVCLAIEPGEKVCLLGRNGEGKSSLMRLLTKEIEPDSGSLIFEKGLKVGSLPQSLPEADDRSVFDVVAEGLAEIGLVLAQYHALIDKQSHGESLDAESLNELQNLQEKIESQDGWSFQTKIINILKRFGLDENQQMKALSGGWRRRVLLAKALINEPDLLLLDEPTNHLDIDTIKWLEQRLKEFQGALLFVSHDRAFIKSLASGIIELDRGNVAAFKGSYESYLIDKQKMLEDEARQDQLFDKRLSEEEVWIRQGIKARRTRNEGRVRALKAMRDERRGRIEKQGKANIKIEEADKSGKLVVEVKGVSHSFSSSERLVIKDFSLTVMRGERIGLIGANGAGKTTLLQILLGKLIPASGSVRLGSKLEVAYFDQLRGGLDPEKTVFDNVADGHDFININGNSKHVISYLNDFLFTAERARTPVKALSGGETNRLLLAKLFGRPSNVIVMDEPTNDLDVDTLELLEERLNSFTGTLLLTSHDRDFIDQVVTSTLVFEGQGKVSEYVGGYQDWVRQTGGVMAVESKTIAQADEGLGSVVEPEEVFVSKTAVKKPVRKKMSYKLKHELEQLPAKIEGLEEQVEALQARMALSDFYNQSHEVVEEVIASLTAAERALEEAEERWLELEEEAE